MSHLNTIDIIRAWKDPEYRLSLSKAERVMLPEHPAGFIELGEAELGNVVGGRSQGFLSIFSCDPPKQTEQQFCTTPCSTSLACPGNCGGGGLDGGPQNLSDVGVS